MNVKYPVCESCEHVILANTFSKVGSVVGGVGAAVPLVGTAVGVGIGTICGAILGALGGAAAGHVAGEDIDKRLGKYRCEKYSTEFESNL